jgi:hypothetical protein
MARCITDIDIISKIIVIAILKLDTTEFRLHAHYSNTPVYLKAYSFGSVWVYNSPDNGFTDKWISLNMDSLIMDFRENEWFDYGFP